MKSLNFVKRFKLIMTITVLILTCVFVVVVMCQLGQAGHIMTLLDCPNRGIDDHGYWTLDEKEGQPRCLLRCYEGFEPNSCHVLRKTEDKWSYVEPHCQKKPWVSLKTVGKVVAAGVVGAGAVVAAPVVLTATGFTSAGVAAGSIAAGVQGSAAAAGSWFALAQSAGAAGLATGTKAALFSGVSSVTGVVSNLFGESCEAE